MQTLNDLGPSKLLDGEQDRIRYAADNLIFSSNLAEDVTASEGLHDVEYLCRALVASGRWEQVTATRLIHDIAECGPPAPAEHRAA